MDSSFITRELRYNETDLQNKFIYLPIESFVLFEDGT